MNIFYIDPLSRAWARMKHILFNPFDLGKWLPLGFTAFLADLLEGPRGINYRSQTSPDLPEIYGQISTWIVAHLFWVASGLALAIILGIIFAWLSSRGTFMFLDNVVHDRTLISKPWHDFQRLGDSLFLWRLGYGVVSILAFGVLAVFFIITLGIHFMAGELSSHLGLLFGFILVGIVLGVITIFISRMLNDFVVPLMYKYDLSATEAWRKFLPLMFANIGEFILYMFFIIGLYILFYTAIMLGGILTCCLGLLVLIIPYVGSVAVLPMTVTFRVLSLEFLAQFGDEYTIAPAPSVELPPPADETVPPTV